MTAALATSGAEARLGRADAYVARVLDIAAARPLALDTFLRVSHVEWSAEVSTACIECADRPRLLLNAAFVERYCHTPDRLAALLLHELAHVSMGHTRMFPRPTPAHNVACDAIINREIAAMAVELHADVPALTALFTEFYAADASPEFLLRPPPGWPARPAWDASRGAPRALRDIHKRLYAPQRVTGRHLVQYGEIVDALIDTQQGGRGGPGGAIDGTPLLGAHGITALERSAMTGGRDAIAGDVLGGAMAPITGRLAGVGSDEITVTVAQARRRAELERALRALLRRCFLTGGTRGRVTYSERPTRTVLPHHDRRGPARVALARAFGAPRPLLFDDSVCVVRREPTHATIYLDVSGSMHGVLPALHAALVPLRRELRPRILLFSTVVAEADAAAFDRGQLNTTGGTSITPVLQHALGRSKADASRNATLTALVLTDGYFDPPSGALARAITGAGIELHLGVVDRGPLHDTQPWVASATRLPL